MKVGLARQDVYVMMGLCREGGFVCLSSSVDVWTGMAKNTRCVTVHKEIHTECEFSSALIDHPQSESAVVKSHVCSLQDPSHNHLFLASSMKSGTPITAVKNVNANENVAPERLNAKMRKNATTTLSAFQTARAIITASPQVQ